MITVPLERRTHRSVLGVRCIDAATGAVVGDGLEVTAWQIGGHGPLFAALRAASSGVYGLRSLPGLEAYVRDERPLTDFCADADAPPTYYLAIEDRQRRFLPQLHRLCLPRAALIVLPLYSNPARALGPTVGVLRGQAVQKTAGDPTPAPYAILTARFGNNGPVYETVSDERGAFALFVPYPKPGTPAGQWTVTVRVRSNVASLTSLPGIPIPSLAALPDFAVIMAQAIRQIFDTSSDATSVNAITRTLVAGVDLVVASNEGGQRLFIQSSA